MTSKDPIASATLARLYLTQGHGSRARAILEEVLARDPHDGDALALRARLRPRPRLAATIDDGLALRWQGVSAPERLHLVVLLLGEHDGAVQSLVTSRPCTGTFGRHRLPLPWARGVLVASLGRVDERGYAPQVVAEPLGWG